MIKIWLSCFNKFMGNKIDFLVLKVVLFDVLGDVFILSCVVILFIVVRFINFFIDGYVGIVVLLVIFYVGFFFVKDIINFFLGEVLDEEMVNFIIELLLFYKYIIGIYDLIIYNYGVGRCIVFIYVEILFNIDIMEIYEIIDIVEREIFEKLDIYLVIYMDLICFEDKEVMLVKKEFEEIFKKNSFVKFMYDFRIVGKGSKKNLIFDIVVNFFEFFKNMLEDDLKEDIIKLVKEINFEYNCVIVVDKDFI